MTKTAAPPKTVREIMTPNPVCVGANMSARDLARELTSNEISGVPVLNSSDKLIGVVSRTDLLRRCVEGPLGSQPSSLFEALAEGMNDDEIFGENLGTVEELMSTDVVTATPDELIGRVARRMAENAVHRVVVVGPDRQVLGIVTSMDALGAFPV